MRKRSTFRRRDGRLDIVRKCWNDSKTFNPWSKDGRFCSRACATAFRKTAYAEAVALRTTGVNAAVLRGQERARAYRESAEYQALVRKSPGDLLRIEQALKLEVKP